MAIRYVEYADPSRELPNIGNTVTENTKTVTVNTKTVSNIGNGVTEIKRGRGRPSTGCALSAAEKQRRYRERKKSQV